MPVFEFNRPPDAPERVPLYVIRIVVGLVLFGAVTLVVYLAGGDSSDPKVLAAAVLAALVIERLVARSRSKPAR